MNFMNAEDIAAMFGYARGLPLNRAVKPGLAISDEALKAVEGMAPVNAAAGMDLASRFPRSSVTGAQLTQQFPSMIEGDRARDRAQKQMFRNQT